jgi:hypothetical protein
VAAAAGIFDSSSGMAMVAMKMTRPVKRTSRMVDGSMVLFTSPTKPSHWEPIAKSKAIS